MNIYRFIGRVVSKYPSSVKTENIRSHHISWPSISSMRYQLPLHRSMNTLTYASRKISNLTKFQPIANNLCDFLIVGRLNAGFHSSSLSQVTLPNPHRIRKPRRLQQAQHKRYQAALRWLPTGSGNLKRKHSYTGHKSWSKTRSRRARLRRTAYATRAQLRKLKKIFPARYFSGKPNKRGTFEIPVSKLPVNGRKRLIF